MRTIDPPAEQYGEAGEGDEEERAVPSARDAPLSIRKFAFGISVLPFGLRAAPI